MLKFSGFADLTSCLGREDARASRDRGASQSETTEKHAMLTWLFAKEFPYALDASKAHE